MRRKLFTMIVAACVSCVALAEGDAGMADDFAYENYADFETQYGVAVSGGAEVSLDSSDGRVRIDVPVNGEATVTRGDVIVRDADTPLTVRLLLARGTGAFTPVRVGFKDAESPRRRVYLQLQRNSSEDRVEIVVRNSMLGSALSDQHLKSTTIDKAALIESEWSLTLEGSSFRVARDGDVVLDGPNGIASASEFAALHGFFYARRNAPGAGSIVVDGFGVATHTSVEMEEVTP